MAAIPVYIVIFKPSGVDTLNIYERRQSTRGGRRLKEGRGRHKGGGRREGGGHGGERSRGRRKVGKEGDVEGGRKHSGI